MPHKGWVSDFETLTYTPTRVWLWASCEIDKYTNVVTGTTIEEYIVWLVENKIKKVYFHNLGFDAMFILDKILSMGYSYNDYPTFNNYNSIISDSKKFYELNICFGSHRVRFWDSWKKLPLSVRNIAKAFNLDMEKGDIDYKLERPQGYEPTSEEISYVKRDVQIVAQALKLQIESGQSAMTIGSDAMKQFKKTCKKKFTTLFPELPLWVDAELRNAYRGGYVIVKDGAGYPTDHGKGVVYDNNSMFPAMMVNHALPYAEPVYFEGIYQKDKYYPLYVLRVQVELVLKPNHLPTVQVKGNNPFYVGTEYISKTKCITDLTMTNVDYELMHEHYYVTYEKVLCGWKFKAAKGIFDDFIYPLADRKGKAVGGERTLIKLTMNNSYGKYATNPDKTKAYPYYEDGVVQFRVPSVRDIQKPIYLPVGAYITAFARFTLIHAAQKLYDRFLYCDTDSLHLTGTEKPDIIEIDESKLGAWKCEGEFTRARFIRAKRYIEDIKQKDGGVKTKITCAGLPERCHKMVTWKNFVPGTVYGEQFTYLPDGRTYDGKTTPKIVPGGVILQNTTFKLK